MRRNQTRQVRLIAKIVSRFGGRVRAVQAFTPCGCLADGQCNSSSPTSLSVQYPLSCGWKTACSITPAELLCPPEMAGSPLFLKGVVSLAGRKCIPPAQHQTVPAHLPPTCAYVANPCTAEIPQSHSARPTTTTGTAKRGGGRSHVWRITRVRVHPVLVSRNSGSPEHSQSISTAHFILTGK